MSQWNGTGPGRRGCKPVQADNPPMGECLGPCDDLRPTGQALCDPCESRWNFHYGLSPDEDRPVLVLPAKDCE